MKYFTLCYNLFNKKKYNNFNYLKLIHQPSITIRLQKTRSTQSQNQPYNSYIKPCLTGKKSSYAYFPYWQPGLTAQSIVQYSECASNIKDGQRSGLYGVCRYGYIWKGHCIYNCVGTGNSYYGNELCMLVIAPILSILM